MRRLGAKGTGVVTLLHMFVALGWFVSAVVVVVLAMPAWSSGDADWNTIELSVRVASMASVATLAIALTYALATPWGFLGSRWLLAKWALYLGAVSASGYAIRAAREHVVEATVMLGLVQVVLLVVATCIGVYLERLRKSGRMARRAAHRSS